ncbi:hypothetical protein EYV94_21500 [Puteibacter caeruleilacunae]|nr:hypothetical protein EYV94_21500 [Puteibacter caeruleilacunae]
MRRLAIVILFLGIISQVVAQGIEEQVVNERYNTEGTAGLHAGKWFRIATCEITVGWQDYGTTFEFIGNGAGDNTFYYGKLVARFKRQDATVGPATHYGMVLFDSNIGAENVKAVQNNTTIDIYVKVNKSYTVLYYRRIMTGCALITAISNGGIYDTLPSGDLVIDCEYPKQYASAIDVSGTITASEVKVEPQTADFVFEDNYKLRSLEEVDSFVTTHKHLPDVPSARQMKEEGIGLSEMNKLLLQKVEELILYNIQQNKEIKQLKTKIQQLEQNKRLK